MALIDVFPININGVKAPLNLLSNLFTNTMDTKNLLYPIDLATNPNYCHAVQFTIFEYEVPEVEQAYNATVGAGVSTVTQAVTSSGSAVQAGQRIIQAGTAAASSLRSNILNAYNTPGGLASAAGNIGTNVAKAFQASTYKPKTAAKPEATISLYMPDTLTTTYNSNYTAVSMTETLGVAGYIGNAVADFASSRGNAENKANLYAKAGTSGFLSNVLSNKNFKGVLDQAFKTIPNPQMQLIYKGINLREFQLEFLFTPVSTQEAQSVEKIIQTFVYYSVPEINQDSQSGQFLIPPQIFKIKFSFTGKSGIAGTIQTIFQNTLTNIIGSQLTGAVLGSNPSKEIENATKAKIFEVGDCVLSNVSVDYAPNGWAAYSDGYPIQTRLTLQFKEMEIVTKDKIIKRNIEYGNLDAGAIPSQVDLSSSITTKPLP